MPEKIPFVKMQGAGNDYVYINTAKVQINDPASLAKKISDRHFGVGSDGLVLIQDSENADLAMRMFNSDGSEAEMCGNASRCVAKYAFEQGLVQKPEFTLETGAGIKTIRLNLVNNTIESITVDMGEPILDMDKIPCLLQNTRAAKSQNTFLLPIGDKNWEVTAVGMGNPHAAVFVDDIDALDLEKLGPMFENNSAYPKKTNTEFVQVISPRKIRMRVWERGAGETLACGTGACAALVASVINQLTENEAEVEVAGGKLKIKWDETNNHIYMTGPAETVFEGIFVYE